jgi:hypothetical protein
MMQSETKISEITRRDIFDCLRSENWHGRLEETEFLSRIFDLKALPSNDARFRDAGSDIWQHRINNPGDWDDDWIFKDSRFQLEDGPDEVLLRFLCETIHPVVRPEIIDCVRLCELYNDLLKHDGYEIVERTRISGRPVFAARYIGLHAAPAVRTARDCLVEADESYVAQQITRMESAISTDPSLAIGTAKELVESCCRTILASRSVNADKSLDLPQLVKITTRELRLTPNDIPDSTKAAETIKRLLSNLATITQGIAELRNQYGTGHGRDARSAKGLQSRHAKLAVGAASTLAVFMMETYREREQQGARDVG